MKRTLLCAFACLLALSCFRLANAAPVVIVSQFNPGLGSLDDIAVDPATGNVFIHREAGLAIRQYTQAGAAVAAIALPGAATNDFGLDFSRFPGGSINVNGVLVSGNSLLVTNGDDSPEMFYAVNKSTGVVLSSLVLPSISAVGGAYHDSRGSFFSVDFTGADLVREIDLATGAELNSFSPQAGGFDIFYGDVAVDPVTGNLYLVSDTQDTIRIFSPDGVFLQDLVSPVTDMTGASFDPATGNLWVTNLAGDVTELAFTQVPEPTSLAVFGLSALGALAYRRRHVS